MAEPPPPSTPCANCGAPPAGEFCPACGQPAGPPARALREFLHDLLGGLLAFDGRIWRSLVPLFCRPGELTRAWILGRRASYTPPLRLFLFFSILLFLVISCETDVNSLLTPRETRAEQPEAEQPEAERDEVHVNMPLPEWRIFAGLRTRFAEQEKRLEDLRPEVRNYVMARRGLELAPVALLMLLPLLATFLRLWWLRTGLLWLDHLTLLLHAYAALCGAAALLILLPTPDWVWTALFMGGMPLYAYRSMRVAYGRGFWRSLLGTLAGALATLVALMVVVILLAPYALLTF